MYGNTLYFASNNFEQRGQYTIVPANIDTP